VLRLSLKQSHSALGFAVVVLGSQPRAAAQVDELSTLPPEKVRIEYRAPPECPDHEAFKALVGTRAPPGWQATPEQDARRVAVDVSGAEGQYAATVELVDERGERVAQTLTGAVCSNVVDGIALVTALAIQSRGGRAQRGGDTVVMPASTTPTPPRLALDARPEPGARARQSSANLRASARVALTTGIGPEATPGAGLGIVFEPRGARVGLAVQAFRGRRVEARGVPVRFDLLSARVEACPFVLTLTDWVSIEPYAFVEFGVVTGRAFAAPPAVIRGDRGSAPWYSVGSAGRAVGHFGSFVVELEAALGVPLRRERFHIEPGAEVHRVPAAYGAIAAGLGVRF
jgi:hypothetical protein